MINNQFFLSEWERSWSITVGLVNTDLGLWPWKWQPFMEKQQTWWLINNTAVITHNYILLHAPHSFKQWLIHVSGCKTMIVLHQRKLKSSELVFRVNRMDDRCQKQVAVLSEGLVVAVWTVIKGEVLCLIQISAVSAEPFRNMEAVAPLRPQQKG